MDFERFKEQLMEDLKDRLFQRTGEEVVVSSSKVNKLQNASYEGIVVRKENDPVGINLDAGRFYQDYESGRLDYDEILSNVEEVAVHGLDTAPSFDVSNLTDYNVMKEHLSMQVVATERNADMLERIPHKEIEDMSVVYRFIVSTDTDGIGSILITNDLLKNMGVTEEQLFSDAQKYAPDLRPSEIKGMADVLAEMMGVDVNEIDSQLGRASQNAELPIYVASTHDLTNGAGIIAYPGFMEMAAEKVGGDFFLLPSSVHEVLLIPDRGNADYHEFERMVREVNATQVQPQDQLSDNVYHYDSKEKVFELAEKFDVRKKEKSAEKNAEKDSVLKDLSAEKKKAADAPRVDADKAIMKKELSL